MPKRRDQYRHLEPGLIVRTIEALRQRILERFPESGLLEVATELVQTSRETARRARRLTRPMLLMRIPILAGAVGGLAGLAYIVLSLDIIALTRRADPITLTQGMESVVNLVIVIGAFVWSLWKLEDGVRRGRIMRALHEFRSLAHVVDMHQLTKDPTIVLGPGPAEQRMSQFALARYLDYCAEMLSLIGKLAALYAAETDDPEVVRAVNEIETLTTDMGRKIWQKITILGDLKERVG
jgi:hypothetical protein